MANRNIKGDVNVEFTEASSRQGLDSGDSVKTLFGKLRKWLSDLKPVAFSGSYNDLSDKPTIPTASVTGVKGDSETDYRTGNVNLTPANIGAAPVSHTQASSTITAMTGYTKPSSTSAITASDTLNAAIGKLEKGYDNVNATIGNINSVLEEVL